MKGKSWKYHTLIGALCITVITGWGQQGAAVPDPNYLEPDKEAKVAVSKIVRYTGLAPNFIIVEGDVSTALAYIKDNKRYIAYNPAFIRKLRTKTRTDWGAVSVLAHEIGHHLSGHTLAARKNSPGDELAADKFSGFILHQMGASLAQAQAALHSIGHEIDTLLHPPKAARLKAITRGWEEAAALRDKKAYSPQTISRGPNADYPIARFAFKCRFKGDDNVYFVDQAQQVVWFDNYGKPIVIGNVSESESERYEWMYYYQDKIYGIDHKGVIWKETTHGASLRVGRAEVIAEPEN